MPAGKSSKLSLKPKKRLKTYLFLVELRNNTDRRDDEAVQVRALSKKDAADIARGRTRGRFSIGSVVLARGNKRPSDKELASHLRGICTHHI